MRRRFDHRSLLTSISREGGRVGAKSVDLRLRQFPRSFWGEFGQLLDGGIDYSRNDVRAVNLRLNLITRLERS